MRTGDCEVRIDGLRIAECGDNSHRPATAAPRFNPPSTIPFAHPHSVDPHAAIGSPQSA